MNIKALKSVDISKILLKYILEFVLVILIITMSFGNSHFFTANNLLNILRDMAVYGVIAFGMTMVLILAEVDLSIGSTIALSGVLVAKITGMLAKVGIPMTYGVIFGMIGAIIIALLIGFFNGFILTYVKMPSFISTLAMQFVLYGVAAIICNSFPLTTLPQWYNFIGAGYVFNVVPFPAIILLIIFVIMFFIMKYTKFGRSVYVVGGNPEAARLAGINVKRVKTTVMIIVQFFAAIGGIMLSSLVMSANQQFGKGYEMNVISSCVIGGTSLFGGIGNMWGTFIGLIFVGVINNGMTLVGVNDYVQYIVRGGLTLFAVYINTMQLRRKN
jgi:ribose/xylose/arabinose/galactoside ABC-type transport system permease subunit